MNYKIVSTEKEIVNLKKAWDNLYHNLDKKTVFQSYIWNYTWWKENYNDHRLFVVIFYEQTINDLSAIFPLMVSSRGKLRFIADTHSDYSDFLIKSDSRVDAYALFKTFYQIVNREEKIRTIELKNLILCSNHYAIFVSIFGHRKILHQTNASSYLKLSGVDINECFSYIKAKKRNQIKRLYKKNSHLNATYHAIETGIFPAKKIKEIVNEMVKKGVRDKNFLNPTMILIIEQLYKNGHLMIQEIKDKEETVVMNLILREKGSDRYLLWITVYRDLPKINIISYFILIKNLCKKDGRQFTIDFGRGLYEYKITNFLPTIHSEFTFFYTKRNFDFITYLIKEFTILAIKPFYKKHKKLINKVLCR